ncbi:MAG: phospholipase D-like domain-containing protein, partial [Acetobacter sp.]|nr:phospholipase D-like domain-containing protein [Acetobacter sp.]
MMFFDWFMLGLRISCAVSVVMHVLLTRREPSTAIGWIGITVLMPFTGFVLYLMFGVNRVRRLAQRLTRNMSWGGGVPKTRWQYTVSGPMMPLAHMMGQLTERHVVDGNKVDILHDGDQAYPLMLETIASARTSVFLCSYIFRGDGIGMQFVDALVAAHGRGVEVRVITDGIGGGYFLAPACKALRRHGVPVGRFMHSLLPWRMPFINLRNHRKILIVDGNIGFMGGINIGDENLVKKQPPYPVSDTHFRLGGPIIRQLTEAFARDWAFVTGENLTGPEYFPEIDAAGKIPMRIVTAGPDSDLEKIEFAMLQALALSRSSVSLMTPYFLPGARLRTELSLAAIRGVKVDIVLPLVSNHRLIDLASR